MAALAILASGDTKIRLDLQHAPNECRRRALDYGMGMARLAEQVYEIQNQRLPGKVTGERPQRTRCQSRTMSLVPGNRESDDDLGPGASRLPGSRP